MTNDQLEAEGAALIEAFKKKMKTAAEEVLGEVYMNIMPHIESDSWLNFRNQVRDAMQSDYQKPEFLRGEDYDALRFRGKIFAEHRKDLIVGLNKDLLARIAELEQKLKQAYERDRW